MTFEVNFQKLTFGRTDIPTEDISSLQVWLEVLIKSKQLFWK